LTFICYVSSILCTYEYVHILYIAYVVPLRYLSLKQYFACLFADTVPVPFLYSYIPLVSTHLWSMLHNAYAGIQYVLIYLKVQELVGQFTNFCIFNLTFMLHTYYFILYPALSAKMSEWRFPVLPFKIF
jgi:hypothetical protein